ncbi:MAG: hormogonium polysaccharide secretion pseudopilin HpsC [Cylindrospermopsis raciborskii 1523720]|uniref:hormogonium polysaccharide secretion pseudopilin HpsC n=1 Tax=Cylindrospermopsis raciborskii TaxID=77022 RepID=UPI002B4A0BA4|nr:hormogonium polysaccharide secretion pseudopilin HpsC [Cylindrospermopsis raciborskii]MEB3146236.1 hormogonium polysaccharide secretion pseudopilin HpsC [Cylindrospermopsis raciborskii]
MSIISFPTPSKNRSFYGFTIVQLLVGLTIGVISITLLLRLLINVMEINQQEQAKITTGVEIQTALDYIANDLKQAIYIYDAQGINAIRSQLPSTPTGIDRVPVLVFWRQETIENVLPVRLIKDDAFVYSLVVYYLIRDTTASVSEWSKSARIARWKIRDGVLANTEDFNQIVLCNGYTGTYYIKGNFSSLEFCPEPGFAAFNLNNSGSLEQIMNGWRKHSARYTNDPIVLVDYIDSRINNIPPAVCPPNSTNPKITWSRVTSSIFSHTTTGRMTSFYACVDRLNVTAQVFIRGDAVARIPNNLNINNNHLSHYFPTVSTQVQGRGFFYK